jgi:SAM-dependent methyltransferase
MSAVTEQQPAPLYVGRRNEAARVEWLERTLAKVPAGLRILDAGAGEQRFKPLCAHLNYVSQDFAQYDGAGDGSGLQTGAWDQTKLDLVSDVTAIPEPDASFDAVLCVEVLEHVPDPLAALDEFARLLKPGGYLIVTAPFCSLTHMAPYHFCTGFGRYFYREHLERRRGFELLDFQENGNFFEYLAQETRRLRGVARRYAGQELRPEESAAVHTVLEALQRFSALDQGSSEILCFGCHVFARKVGPVSQKGRSPDAP